MPKTSGQKLKLLLIKDYLLKYSDEKHLVTVNDIIAYLESHGVAAERKSIYDDIDALESYGLDIVRTKGKSGGYYVASREFELPEVKLLVDAVQSSRFITGSKTLSLIKKIESLASSHEGRSLQRQVVVQNRVKSMNESVYYNVDALSEAIELGRQIEFRYFDYGPDKERRYRHDGGYYRASPEFLVWDDENYYLVACPDSDRTPRHYRVDKMTDIKVLTSPALISGADPAQYTNTLFGMYSGQRQNVRIKFKNAMAGVAIDRFGKDMVFAPFDAGHFTVNVDVTVSPQFMAWIAGLGDGAEILEPEGVRREMKDFLLACLENYR